ncbi:hypothetical protein MLD38_028003 [Melastoma candidum]|uniref:Uncharacterized protein n=1 Tax=Melastoma candidum TaxID=119954 RepID=A0ACB9MZJ6_9MYRT|nr:hypothetical protein MLD38_028003 [Melastoma candidum]
MGTIKVLRRSVSKFLQGYHYFTIIPTICILPFSTTLLLSQAHLLLFPSSHPLPWFLDRLATLFEVAGLPTSSGPFSVLLLKISETVASFVRTLPFTFTFLLLGKSLALLFLSRSKPSASSLALMYAAIVRTYVCGLMAILSANATAFFVLFLVFDCINGLGISSPGYSTSLLFLGVIVYSTILSYTVVVCNLSLTVSGIEKRGGFMVILKTCFLTRKRELTALSLAVPINLLRAATEALFQYRVVTTYQQNGRFSLAMVSEGCFIAYWYSVFIVLDVVISHTFLKSRRFEEEDNDACCDENDEKISPELFKLYINTCCHVGINRRLRKPLSDL